MNNIKIIKHPTIYCLEDYEEGAELFFKIEDGLIIISTEFDFSVVDSEGTFYPECEKLTVSPKSLKEIIKTLEKYEDLK